MIFLKDLPKDCYLHAQVVVSKLDDPRFIEHLAMDNLHKRLCEAIVHTKHTTREDNYSITHRLEVLVFTPDEFFGVVQRAAMELALRTRPPQLVPA